MSKYTCCEEEPVVKPYARQVQLIPAILQRAPPWCGVAIIDGKLTDLSSKAYEEKYTVIVFYPYDFTFVCPTELIQFSDRVKEFENLDAQVIAVSTDSAYAHFAWVTTPRKQGGLGEMNIPLLADRSHQISKDYGILDVKQGVALRALFIIDNNQRVRHVGINDVGVSRSVDETLRVIQACQFVDKYGDICPIGPVQKQCGDEMNYFDFT